MFFLFPVRDEYGVKRFPGMILTMILVNCLVYFAFGFRGAVYEVIVKRYGFTPSVFAPVTLLTSMFLHGSLLHLGFNMWYLWLLGDNLEDRWGHGRFLLFYLCAGVFASILYSVMIPAKYAGIPTIGASGAISGVLGAYAVLFPKSRVTFKYLIFFLFVRVGEFELYAGFWLGLWFFQQALYSFLVAREVASSSVAFAAHLSGFLFGAIVAFGARLFQEARRRVLVAEGQYALEQLLAGPKRAAALTFEQEASVKSRSNDLIGLMEDDRVTAGELYEKLLQTYPELTLPEKWQYQLAESLERQGKKEVAAAACRNFMRHYPYSKLADNILFFLGKHFLKEGDYEKAKNALRQVVLFYPYSDVYEEAKFCLEKELPEKIAAASGETAPT